MEHPLGPRLPGAPRAHAVDAWLPSDAQVLRGLVFFSHGFGGHRRQSTFVLAHLASYGYAVVSVDHVGPLLPAIMAQAMAAKARGEALGPAALFGELPVSRPKELLALLPVLRAELTALCSEHGFAAPGALPWAVLGHSFGAYTGLVAAARSQEIRAVVALAPAGGPGPVFVPAFAQELALAQLVGVRVLYLAAEHDSLVPLASVESLWAASADARLYLLEDADHVHFCDHVSASHAFLRAVTSMPEVRAQLAAARDYGELCAEEVAHRAICQLVTAELEASFHGEPAAEAVLDAPRPPIRLLRRRRGSSPIP